MYFIGIDIGGMSIKGGLVNEKGKILYKTSVKTKAEADLIANDIALMVTEILTNNNLKLSDIKSIGIGLPGTSDPKRGVIIYTTNINFRNYPIVKVLHEKLNSNIPIHINNDANCAALGEAKFGKTKVDNAIFVTLGTGVGTGFIVNGKIFDGTTEGGHIRILMGGEPCGCGRRGCFEAYASASALIKQTKEAIKLNPNGILANLAKKGINGKTAFDAMRAGDSVGKAVVDRYIKYVGEGIVTLLNIFGSEYVIIGGGISHEGDTLLNPLREYVNKNKYGSDFLPETKIITASLYNDAGIIGAAALGM